MAFGYSLYSTWCRKLIIVYLLLPRIPAEDSSHTIQIQGEDISYNGDKSDQHVSAAHSPDTNNPAALFLSFVVLLGWAGLIRKLCRETTDWPESFALSCFFLTLLTLPIRFFFHSVNMAFSGAVAIGIVGWVFILFNYFKKDFLKAKNIEEIKRSAKIFFAHFTEKKKKERILIGLFTIIILAAILWSFIMSVVVVPDDWDAWAIWGSKARVLAQGTGPLYDVTKFSHPDYPLLWPTVWAFSGWLAGGWEECWSKGWGAIFLFFCVWEIIHIVKEQCRNLTVGLLAGALFVSVPNVPLIASWAYAEAPLWLMMICGLACFLRRRQSREGRGDVFLIGLFAAAAAYTKNEGVLFSVLLGGLFFFSGRSGLRPAFIYALTFVLCYIFWWYWTRVSCELGSHATSGLHLDTDSLHRAAERMPHACEAIFKMWRDIRQWNIVGFGIAMALVCSLFRLRQKRFQLFRLFLPVGMLVGYLVIILLNPNEIYWQIGTAWNRLTVQVLPLLIVLLVLLHVPSGRGQLYDIINEKNKT
ncbi:MAG: hypothetical protein D3914_04895 [Candidatus Electrothrix sp. LOE2]|nr:hypothetical protein [Candidatus Electrothrix sp. LOE2]